MIEVQHNLTGDKLTSAIVSLAKAEGVAEGVIETLVKARVPELEHLPTEQYLLEILRSLERKYAATIKLLGDNLKRWLDGIFPSRDPWSISKALPGTLLTAPQIHELTMLIEQHFHPAGISVGTDALDPAWNIPDEIWDRWRTLGIVVEGLPVPEFHDSYVAGRLHQVIREGDSYAEMLKLAVQLPRTRAVQVATEWAAQHGAREITHFGQKLAQHAADEALSANQRVARSLITSFMEGGLRGAKMAPGAPHDLTLDERAVLEHDLVVQDWRGLGRELYKTFRGTESQRDWMRVAVSETRLNYNVGRIDAIAASGSQEMYYLVSADACRHCKRLYLNPDGTPKIFSIKDILHNLAATGGLNVGRKASLIGQEGGWIVTGGLLHPFCRCKPVQKFKDVSPTKLS